MFKLKNVITLISLINVEVEINSEGVQNLPKITKHGGWNKHGGWDFVEKLMHNSNKRGVEGGTNLRNQYVWKVDLFCGGWIF